MHSAHPDPIDVDTEYPGGSALRSRYRISGDGKLWMAEHRWETDDATTSQFGETVALVDPLDLIALASPWWRPVALLNDWQGEPVGSPPGPMLVLVLEAVGGREAP